MKRCRPEHFTSAPDRTTCASLPAEIKLDDGPRISGYRPCADVAFESAAAYGGATSWESC